MGSRPCLRANGSQLFLAHGLRLAFHQLQRIVTLPSRRLDKSIGSPTENLLRVHLVSPDLEVGKLGFAVDGGKGAIHGVRTVGDFDAADARDIEARVEGQPLLSKIHFAAGGKSIGVPGSTQPMSGKCPVT